MTSQIEEIVQPGGATLTADIREAEFDLTVVSREVGATGVVVLTLRQSNHRMLPAWRAGAHIDLLLPEVGPRQYSLCGDPQDRRTWQVGILVELEGRGGSRFVHESLHPESTVRARGPRNHFAMEPADHYLFVAGGIGITPILPMIRHAEEAGAEWDLVYLGRSLETMAFRDQLQVFGDRVTFWPRDVRDRFDLSALLGAPRIGSLVYACGPEELLDAVESVGLNWPRGAIRVERFNARSIVEPVLADAFEIELARTGITVSVPPDKSVLAVLEEQGIHVLSSCGEGTCGTCDTGVLEGEVDHRDSVLTEDERGQMDCMMVCVSRSCGKKLILDL